MALKLACEIRPLPTAAGGRETPLTSGWRGLVSFGEVWTERDAPLWPDFGEPVPIGEEMVYGCELGLEAGAEMLAPGDAARAKLTFPFLDELRPAIHPGATFEVREGNRKVGAGTVLEVQTGRPQ